MVKNILKPTDGCVSKKKRLGCGPGSKLGSTCGRGHDGQRSRSGKNQPSLGFDGGGGKFFLFAIEKTSRFVYNKLKSTRNK